MTGILAVWNDVDDENEVEFNDWYICQHIPERVGVPGFRNGRRHLALSSADPGCPRNFTFYEVDDLSVLSGDAYIERLNHPTEWTRRTMPWFLNMSRTACTVRCALGEGHGSFAGTMQLELAPGREEDFAAWLEKSLFPELMSITGLVRVQFWQGDTATTNVESTERGLRSGADRSVSAAIIVSGTHGGALATASATMPRPLLEEQGATPVTPLHLFQLVYALHKDAAGQAQA